MEEGLSARLGDSLGMLSGNLSGLWGGSGYASVPWSVGTEEERVQADTSNNIAVVCADVEWKATGPACGLISMMGQMSRTLRASTHNTSSACVSGREGR